MYYVKLFALMSILGCAEGAAQNAAISSMDEGKNYMEASVDFTKIQEILSKHEQEMIKMKQNMDDQKSEHEKQIFELRQIIAKQDEKIKELTTFMTESKTATPEQNYAPTDSRKSSDIKPVNATIEELEQRVEDLEVSFSKVPDAFISKHFKMSRALSFRRVQIAKIW